MRYARALFLLADERGQLLEVEKELLRFLDMLRMSTDLSGFIASPLLRREGVIKGLDALFVKAGITGLARQFFHVVVKNGRAAAIPIVIQAFLNALAISRGEVVAHITVARPLTDAQKDMIAGALQQSLSAKGVKKVVIAPKVDASVLGGMMVQIGSNLYDGSMKGQLQKLSQALRANKAA